MRICQDKANVHNKMTCERGMKVVKMEGRQG